MLRNQRLDHTIVASSTVVVVTMKRRKERNEKRERRRAETPDLHVWVSWGAGHGLAIPGTG